MRDGSKCGDVVSNGTEVCLHLYTNRALCASTADVQRVPYCRAYLLYGSMQHFIYLEIEIPLDPVRIGFGRWILPKTSPSAPRQR